MKDGVPSTMPVRVLPAPDRRAMPKSVIFKMSVLGSYIRFAGLMSRWTTCCLWAKSQRFGRAADDLQHLARLHEIVGFRIVAQVPALEIFHRDIGEAALLADIVDGHDIRMIEAAGGFGLAKKTRSRFDEFGVAEFTGERYGLDRHHAVDGGIAAQVDDAHGAASDLPLELVAAEALRIGCRGAAAARGAAAGAGACGLGGRIFAGAAACGRGAVSVWRARRP